MDSKTKAGPVALPEQDPPAYLWFNQSHFLSLSSPFIGKPTGDASSRMVW